MKIPSLRLHELKGNRQGTWAVTVQANWRITFRFVESDAEVVNYENADGRLQRAIFGCPSADVVVN